MPPSLGNHFFLPLLHHLILSARSIFYIRFFAVLCLSFSLYLSAVGSRPLLSNLSQPESLRIGSSEVHTSTEIIITIMIKAGTTCCVRGNIGRGPRYGKLKEGEGQRGGEGREGGSFTCRPGAIVFFFVFHLWHILPCHFSLNRQPSISPRLIGREYPPREGQRERMPINNS